MDLKDLATFRAVVDAGTVTRAALRLKLTQSAVSRIVSGLEEELGFTLFDRIKNRLILSAEGSAFLRETERLLTGVDELREAARDIRQGRLSRIRIVAMPALAHGLLPATLAEFKDAHPRLAVSVDVRRRSEVTRWMAGRQFDLGLSSLPLDHPGIATSSMITVAALVALPAGHPLSRKKAVSVRDLHSQALIGLGTDALFQTKVNQMFAKSGRSPTLTIDTSSLVGVCHFVAQGLGCGIVDPFTASAMHGEEVQFRRLEPRIALEYGTIMERDRHPSDVVKELCECLRHNALKIARRFARLLAEP